MKFIKAFSDKICGIFENQCENFYVQSANVPLKVVDNNHIEELIIDKKGGK